MGSTSLVYQRERFFSCGFSLSNKCFWDIFLRDTRVLVYAKCGALPLVGFSLFGQGGSEFGAVSIKSSM